MDAVREKRAPKSRSPLEVVTFQGVWGEWDEEARQDIPAPPSPRPSGCVLVPPHSRLSQSSGFSLSAGGNPNSTLYGCSSAKLRILIKYYHNAFSLYCLVLLPALVSLLIWSRMIKKCFDHQPFSWDSSGRSHRMSPWTWAGAVRLWRGSLQCPHHSPACWTHLQLSVQLKAK